MVASMSRRDGVAGVPGACSPFVDDALARILVLGGALVHLGCGATAGGGDSSRPAPPRTPATSLTIRQGVVVVPGSETVYATAPGAGIVAIDLASGTPRWTSPLATSPLAARGSELVALDGRGELRVLDAATGALHECVPYRAGLHVANAGS